MATQQCPKLSFLFCAPAWCRGLEIWQLHCASFTILKAMIGVHLNFDYCPTRNYFDQLLGRKQHFS